MRLSVKDMDIATGGTLIAILNEKDAGLLDLHPSDRVRLEKGRRHTVAVIDFAESERAIPRGNIGLFEEVLDKLDAYDGDNIKLFLENKPESIKHIKEKLDGEELSSKDIYSIISDVVAGKLTSIELTYFVAANYSQGMSLKETIALTKAMIKTGEQLKFKNKIVVDKHCIGGVAGNRTTMAVVPIMAAAGLFMPKTSSRAITSPAGTADTMEVISNVVMDSKKIKNILKKTGGIIAWGGAVNLAPADDMIINIEHPLSVDPEGQLLASIMAKKGSAGANRLLIDIPVGPGAKVAGRKEALHLKKMFEKVGKALKIQTRVVITDGKQPIGNGIGPALEARDVMWVLKNDPRQPLDLRRKCIALSAELLELAGKCKRGKGKKMAEDLLHSGKAYKKMWDIIKAQGAKIKSIEDIKFGKHQCDFLAHKSGKVKHVDNMAVAKIARVAGCPKDHGAGLYLNFHVGDKVKKDEVLFTIYAQSEQKLKYAIEMADNITAYVL